MGFNVPFAVSQNSADASYLQQMALSFIALRLNVSSETVDASHQALLQYIRPGAQNQMKVILAEEAKRIKNDNVNSAFSRPVFVSGLSMAVWKFVVCLKPGLVIQNLSLISNITSLF